MSIIAIILIFTFFITSADSATYVLSMLSEDGRLIPTNGKKVVWGVIVAGIATVLLYAGGLDALRNTLIIIALPFAVVIALIVVALIVEVYHEKVQMGLSISPDRYPEKGQPFKSYESYESEDEAEKSIEDEADTSAQQVKQGKKTSEPAKQE